MSTSKSRSRTPSSARYRREAFYASGLWLAIRLSALSVVLVAATSLAAMAFAAKS